MNLEHPVAEVPKLQDVERQLNSPSRSIILTEIRKFLLNAIYHPKDILSIAICHPDDIISIAIYHPDDI